MVGQIPQAIAAQPGTVSIGDSNSRERNCDSPVEKLSLSSMVVGQIPQGYSGTASDRLHRGQEQTG